MVDTASREAQKTIRVLLLALLMVCGLELVLQVRSHVQRGQSVFNLVTAETRYVHHPITGLKLLRPDRVFRGSEQVIRTNSLGLRSANVSPGRAPDSLRLAILGASTVMGAYAKDNDKTLAGFLEKKLSAEWPGRQVEVINAGIAGYTLYDQQKMLETVVAPLAPDRVLVYPGFNDFADYCGAPMPAKAAFSRKGLPTFAPPAWVLSIDLVLKNTVFLRHKPQAPVSYKDARTIDLGPYRQRLRKLMDSAERLGVPLLMLTNARAYQRDQAPGEQSRLAETARYFNPCFDVEGLHTLYERHNDAIRAEAKRAGVPAISLGEQMRGGRPYFADSTHFSERGEELAANIILAAIRDELSVTHAKR
jgi:lysophospholipase L1-like esterase